jgi:hypothetical protein
LDGGYEVERQMILYRLEVMMAVLEDGRVAAPPARYANPFKQQKSTLLTLFVTGIEK